MNITVTVEVVLNWTEREVWPDGNQPDEITAEVVKGVMESCGSKRRVLDEWSILDDPQVYVHVGHTRRWRCGPDADS